MDWEFQMPTKIIFGRGSLGRLWENVNRKRVLLVTGKGRFREQSVGRIRKQLSNVQLSVYDDVEPNPTHQNVDGGVEVIEREGCELVIAFGGGSIMDAAKLMACIAVNKGKAYEYAFQKKKIENKSLPLIAIPTTAGTGSEVTPFSVISDREKSSKLQ